MKQNAEINTRGNKAHRGGEGGCKLPPWGPKRVRWGSREGGHERGWGTDRRRRPGILARVFTIYKKDNRKSRLTAGGFRPRQSSGFKGKAYRVRLLPPPPPQKEKRKKNEINENLELFVACSPYSPCHGSGHMWARHEDCRVGHLLATRAEKSVPPTPSVSLPPSPRRELRPTAGS